MVFFFNLPSLSPPFFQDFSSSKAPVEVFSYCGWENDLYVKHLMVIGRKNYVLKIRLVLCVLFSGFVKEEKGNRVIIERKNLYNTNR